MSSISNKTDTTYDQSYNALSWLGNGLLSWPVKAVSKITELAVYVLEIGEYDIDPETLENYRTNRVQAKNPSPPFYYSSERTHQLLANALKKEEIQRINSDFQKDKAQTNPSRTNQKVSLDVPTQPAAIKKRGR